MKPQAFQPGEIRDENDNIIQNGAYGKLSAFVNAQNDGILDYLMNNLETLNNAVLGNYLIFPALENFPETGDASKVYIDNGTGKPYKWNGTGYTELNQKDLVIVKQDMLALLEEAKNSAKAAKQSEENAKTWDPTSYTKTIKITKPDNSGYNVCVILEEIEDYYDYNYHLCGGSFSVYSYVRVGGNAQLKFPPAHCALSLPYNTATNVGYVAWSTNGTYVPIVIKNNETNKVYWGISIIGSGHHALIFGAFHHNIDVITTLLASSKEDVYDGWTVLKKAEIKELATKEELKTECVDKINELNTALKNGFTTASLTISGETSVPTPATTNKSNTMANTEFVHDVVSELVNGAPTALDTLQELASALGNDPNFSTTILNKIGEKESKTDAQREHKKLQNAIDACLESKVNMGITPESNPQKIDIPLEKGMFPISGYPDGFTVTDRKYPYSLVVNFQGEDGVLLSLYAQHMRRELYFRVGWPDKRGWGPWNKFATTNDIDAIKPSLLTGNNALFNYLHRNGTNPTLPTTNQELTALGVFISYYWNNIIAHQPTQFGQIINLPADSTTELAQLWIAQTSGQMYHRGGNTRTPINDVPFTRFLDEDDATKLEAKIPTNVSQLTDDVGIAKISNGHLSINGSELWIE